MANFKIPPMVKPKIDRSNFNFSAPRRFTTNIGLHVPFYVKPVLPGDEWRISDVTARIRTNPFVSPLMGSFRVQLDWFFEPLTNLYGFMDNNDTNTSSAIMQQSLHRIGFYKNGADAGTDSAIGAGSQPAWFCRELINSASSPFIGIGHVSPSTLMNFLGLPSDFDVVTAGSRPFVDTINSTAPLALNVDNDTKRLTDDPNASASPVSVNFPTFRFDSFYGYWDIVRNYYVNSNFKYAAVYTGSYTLSDSFGHDVPKNAAVDTIPLTTLDNVFKELRMMPSNLRLISNLTNLAEDGYPNLSAFLKVLRPAIRGTVASGDYNFGLGSGKQSMFVRPFSGLACARWRPDYYTAMMLPTYTTNVSVSTEGEAFTINTLRLMSHMQQLYDLYDASGGRFSNWMSLQYDVDVSNAIDRPVLLNSSHYYLNVDDIYSATQTNPTNSDNSNGVSVGEQFGMVNTGCGFKGVKFRSRYHGYLYGIMTIIPETDYSQGIDGLCLDKVFSDIYTPAMAQLGYQDMIRWDFCAGAPIPFDATAESLATETNTTVDEEGIVPFAVAYKYAYGSSSASSPNTTGVYSHFDRICGKNVHWWRYMSDVGRTCGSLSIGQPLESWTNQRSYIRQTFEHVTGNKTDGLYKSELSFFPYVIPDDYQYYFAYQESGSQNWIVQVSLDITVGRSIPKYVLGRIV